MPPPIPFAVEEWMDEYETKAKHNVAETCCASISLQELAGLREGDDKDPSSLIDFAAVQTYGNIRGDQQLRDNLASLYSSKTGTPLSPDNILITPGAIAANHLVFYSLLSPGDHVICHYPTYQQLYSVPESLGAEVEFWRSDPAKNWLPDIEQLKSLVREDTKLIILNNPQNPTGQVLPKSLLHDLIDFIEPKGITILCDEVYRPLFHGISPIDKDFPPSVLSLGYKNTIVTGSLSKAYSLAGIRIGWVASRSTEIAEQIAKARHYTTISVSLIDQAVAASALAPHTIHGLLARNISIAKANTELLERFVIKHDEYCSWTRPVAGTTAFIKFERDGQPIDTVAFCKTVLDRTGVLLLPGDAGFGNEFKGYVRFGYVCQTETLKEALEELRKFMRKEFDDVPLLQQQS